MEGLSVKVFRTYNASITLDRLLWEEKPLSKTVEEKKADYDLANKEVWLCASLCCAWIRAAVPGTVACVHDSCPACAWQGNTLLAASASFSNLWHCLTAGCEMDLDVRGTKARHSA